MAVAPRLLRFGALAIAGLALHCGGAQQGEPQAPRPVAATATACARCDAALSGYVDASPAVGREAGLHEYDGHVADYSRAGIQRRIAAATRDLADLDVVDRRALSPDAALDLDMIRWSLREELFDLVDRALWRTDPAYYRPGDPALPEGGLKVQTRWRDSWSPLSWVGARLTCPEAPQSGPRTLRDTLIV